MRNRYIWLFLIFLLLGTWQTSAVASYPQVSLSLPVHASSLNDVPYWSTIELLSPGSTHLSSNSHMPWYTSTWAYVGYTLLTTLLLYGTWMAIMHRDRRSRYHRGRHRELLTLRATNRELSRELALRNAEIVSQSSMLLSKNELITRMRDLVEDFTHKQGNKSLTPLYYKINTLTTNNLDTESDWKLFLIRFEQTHTGFFRTLKELYPELTCSDLRLCACLKLRLDSKQIAALMSLSLRAVENSRYRLRKKLSLDPSQNLNDFLMSIDSETTFSECCLQEGFPTQEYYKSAS